MDEITRIYRRHGEEIYGRCFTESEFEEAVDAVIKAGYGSFTNKAIIDSTGRIYIDGFHVGWARREAGLPELANLAGIFDCHLPSPLDMRSVMEGEAR